MPIMHDIARAAACYRVTLPLDVAGQLEPMAMRIAEALHEFQPVELRVSAERDEMVLYVSVPADVMPEALDRKTDALLGRWATGIDKGG